MSIRKSYSELVKIENHKDRFDYLKLKGVVGEATFGGHRCLNQLLYRNLKWKETRNKVILRDDGCDLAHKDYRILGRIYVHHINPITIEDVLDENPCVFDLDNLVCVTFGTHNDIHFGTEYHPARELVVRKRYDTCPWR